MEKTIEHRKRSRLISGLMLVLVGVLIFARKLGVEFPDWLFTWQMFLIGLGFYITAKHNFSNPGGYILMLIGSVFLIERFYPDFQLHEFIWPSILIGAGLLLIFKPVRKAAGFKLGPHNEACYDQAETNDQTFDLNAIMGGVKRNIITKDFKGGELNCIMGGAELDFIHAGINGTATIEMNQILGGAKLIVPAHWDIKSEMVVILGGVEDKRPISHDFGQEGRPTLILKGNCIFGGVDIRSY